MEIVGYCSRPPAAAAAKYYAPLSSGSSAFLSAGGRLRAAPLVAAVPRLGLRRRREWRCLFGLGVPEMVVIAGVAALVFGPKKLPEIGRSIGKTVKSFQQAAKEFETELKQEPETGAAPSDALADDDRPKKLEASAAKDGT